MKPQLKDNEKYDSVFVVTRFRPKDAFVCGLYDTRDYAMDAAKQIAKNLKYNWYFMSEQMSMADSEDGEEHLSVAKWAIFSKSKEVNNV